jgi:hypothetical protein
MNEVFLKKVNNLVFTIILCVITNNANASIIPDIVIPDREVLELLETGPSWLPKPYKTPIEQGVLIENENLQKLTPGLDKQQVHSIQSVGTIYIMKEMMENFLNQRELLFCLKMKKFLKYMTNIG